MDVVFVYRFIPTVVKDVSSMVSSLETMQQSTPRVTVPSPDLKR
jgi:hypothetical protein